MEKAIKNITAERIVIGTLLNHPNWFVELGGELKPDYFFLLGHKTIFYVIAKLVQEGAENIDSMSILSRAERIVNASRVIEENGGIEYLEEIKEISEHYTIDDLKRYSQEVITASYKRDVIKQMEEAKKQLHENPNWTMEETKNYLYEQDQSLQNKYSVNGDVKLIGDVFDEVLEEIEEMRNNNGILGLPSKIYKVNEYFSYQNGELVVIGARAKYGKSNFGINEAHWLAVENGIPVAYLDTEMKTRIFLARILSIDSQVPLRAIINGTYKNDDELKMRVEASMERIKKAPLVHKYNYNWDKAKIANTAKLLQLRYGIQFLIYDYIKVKEVSSGVKEHSQLGNMTIFLKDLAGEMDIPILTFAQLSPYEIRLADSDKINRYASTVAYLLPKDPDMISRDFGADKGGTDYMYIDYNRLGESMDDPKRGINLFYDRKRVTFEQADYQILEDDFQ